MALVNRNRVLVFFILIISLFVFYQATLIVKQLMESPLSPEKQYVQLIDQYRLVKMKRLLLEEQAALARTKQQIIALANKVSVTSTPLAEKTHTFSFNLPWKNAFTHSTSNTETDRLGLSAAETKTYEQLEAYISSRRPKQLAPLTADEQTINKLNPAHYTLQLMGVRDITELLRFVKENQFANKGWVFHTFYLNKDWYVLISGDFANRAEALKGIEKLPAQIRAFKPWVRQLATIHKAIQLYR